MKANTLTVTIANVPVSIPVYRDEATTRAIAEEVDKKIREIESSSTRIDTHQFAIQAAAYFAMHLDALRTESTEDAVALQSTLSKLNESLQSVNHDLEELL
jgi:cell division protein ZapA (FtsZ GTPase activity inhibitor)